MKTTPKHKRNAAKAKARSRRNTANMHTTNAQQRRVARRAEARVTGTLPPKKIRKFTVLGRRRPQYILTREQAEKTSVDGLRALLMLKGVKTTTKMRKPHLVDLAAGPEVKS